MKKVLIERLSDGNFRSVDGEWIFLRYELGWNVRNLSTGKWFNSTDIDNALIEANRKTGLDNVQELDTIN